MKRRTLRGTTWMNIYKKVELQHEFLIILNFKFNLTKKKNLIQSITS